MIKELYYKIFRPEFYGALLELERLKCKYEKDIRLHKNSKRSRAMFEEQRAIVELMR